MHESICCCTSTMWSQLIIIWCTIIFSFINSVTRILCWWHWRMIALNWVNNFLTAQQFTQYLLSWILRFVILFIFCCFRFQIYAYSIIQFMLCRWYYLEYLDLTCCKYPFGNHFSHLKLDNLFSCTAFLFQIPALLMYTFGLSPSFLDISSFLCFQA